MTAGIIIAVTAVIILLLTLAATSTPRDHNPAYTIRHKLATRPRHRISRRDRGEHEFWFGYDDDRIGDLTGPDAGDEEARWSEFETDSPAALSAPRGPAAIRLSVPVMSPPLEPLPAGFELGSLYVYRPGTDLPEEVMPSESLLQLPSRSAANDGLRVNLPGRHLGLPAPPAGEFHQEPTTSIDLIPIIRDDLSGCVNVDRYIDRLFSMVDVDRIFTLAGAR